MGDKYMDDPRNWIFAKLPTWLRWIIALPVSVVGGYITYLLLSALSLLGGTGFERGTFFFDLSHSILFFGCCIYVMYLCLPKWKLLITGILSLILGILFFSSIAVLLALGYTWEYGYTITLITSICLIIYSIAAFIYSREDEKQDIQQTGESHG